MVNRSRLNAPLVSLALLVGCNAMFDIEKGTLVEGEAGDSGVGGGSANGGNGGAGGKGGSSGGRGGSDAGKGGSSGTATGGTSGKGGSDASAGKGGSASAAGESSGQGGSGGSGAGAGGVSGSGGSAGGAAASGPFECQGILPTCSTISQFGDWGSGEFHGGASAFGEGLTRDETDPGVLHVTGMVGGWGRGFNLWFTWCSDLSAATGITFTLRGTIAGPSPNRADFQVQTNSTYPWEPFPLINQKGSCTAMPAGTDPWGYCLAPSVAVVIGDAPQTVMWAQITGGSPVSFDSTTSPTEILGVQWQFPWTPSATPYAVDVILDDVKLAGIAPTDCGMYLPAD